MSDSCAEVSQRELSGLQKVHRFRNYANTFPTPQNLNSAKHVTV